MVQTVGFTRRDIDPVGTELVSITAMAGTDSRLLVLWRRFGSGGLERGDFGRREAESHAILFMKTFR